MTYEVLSLALVSLDQGPKALSRLWLHTLPELGSSLPPPNVILPQVKTLVVKLASS